MKKFMFTLIAFCFFLLVSAQQRQKKLIFIIADGIPADVIEKAPATTIKKIAAAGAYARAHVGGEKGTYSETPTISAVGYNSLLTGTWVNKHNVWDNDIKDPNYNYWTLFRFFKQQYPDKKIGIFSTWTDNRTKLAGESMDQTGHLTFDFVADGYELDTVKYPHDRGSHYIHLIDEKVSDEAALTIKNNAPDLSWLYLEYTDDMGHHYGDSPQQLQAIEWLDGQVSRVWDAIEFRTRNFPEDWLIIITTDHGRDAKTGRNHGGQSDRERTTWIVTNAKEVNPYFRNELPGIVDIMPSIASWLDVNIPREQRIEIDGVSFLDPVSVDRAQASLASDSLEIKWKALEKNGNLKIWLAGTNEFYRGGHDQYQLISEVPISKQEYKFSIKNIPSSFYKIVLEAPYNFLNIWIRTDNKK
ncbi:MAG: alkaline phosphatase family protein [Chitinophagales bacterium]